jgi:hypothetical protein
LLLKPLLLDYPFRRSGTGIICSLLALLVFLRPLCLRCLGFQLILSLLFRSLLLHH